MLLKIAIIDDDEDDIAILRLALAETKLLNDAVAWHDPRDAMKSLIGGEAHFIPNHFFIDFNMPTLTGKECVKLLRSDSRFSNSVITIVSTTITPQDVLDFKRLGADHTFEKPGRLAEYVALLTKVLNPS